MTLNFPTRPRLLYLAIGMYLLWVFAFTLIDYQSKKTELYEQLDAELLAAATTLPLLLDKDFHHDGMQAGDISQQEYMDVVLKLSAYARNSGVVYVYSLILKNDNIYFSSSSASEEEIETGEGLTFYLDHYKEVDPRALQLFNTGEKLFLEYTDRWGTFRSVYVPQQAPDGRVYLSCADLDISHIQELLKQNFLNTLMTSFLFLLFAIPLILAFSLTYRELAKSLEGKVREHTQDLTRSNAQLDSILNHSPVGIFHYDEKGVLVTFNKRLMKILGSDEARLTNFNMLAKLTNKKFLDAVKDSLAGKVGHYDGPYTSVTGQRDMVIRADFVPMLSANGELIGGVGVIDDITEKYEALVTQKKLSAAIEYSPNVVVITDNHGIIEYVNPKFSDDTGYSLTEVKGRKLGLLDSDQNEAQKYHDMQSTIMAGEVWQGELINRRKNGELYWSKQLVSPLRIGGDKITHFVSVQEDITESRRIQETITHQASHDMLTGLINRYEFERRLRAVIDTVQVDRSTHAMCFIDLDQFKVINDTCGHVAGDELLRQIGSVIKESLRRGDILARIGGDEFAILLEHCDLERAIEIARGVHALIEQIRFQWEEHSFSIGSSIGLVRIDEFTTSFTEVLRQSDSACYMAKDAGRNRIHIYREDDEVLAQREGEMQWVNVIKKALDEDSFILYAQPIVPVDDRHEANSYEVLIRMLAEDGSLIPPGSFLPAAERYNLSVGLDRWVVDHTLDWLAQHHAETQSIHHIAINLSGPSLGDERLLSHLQQRIEALNCPPEMLCFEITETAAIANLLSATHFIKILRGYGCHFSLDDFGSGLSSFAYLKNLPVDYLKIDGMFVRDILDDPIDRSMVQSINEIGHVMGMKTIAEFVENDDIRHQLREIGVDYVQGYGVGKPAPLESILPSEEQQQDLCSADS